MKSVDRLRGAIESTQAQLDALNGIPVTGRRAGGGFIRREIFSPNAKVTDPRQKLLNRRERLEEVLREEVLRIVENRR